MLSCPSYPWIVLAANHTLEIYMLVTSCKAITCIELCMMCRILGARVSELERKLKTLEMTGLWNTSGMSDQGKQLTCSVYAAFIADQ